MKHKAILCGIALLMLTSCEKEKPHLPPEIMAPVLADLHVADIYSSLVRDSLHLNTEKNYDSLAKWTAEIFARHKVTMKEFNSSMDWYRDRPVELDTLFAHVLPILEKQKK